MYFYRKKGDLSSQEENGRLVTGATCRSRFDESRRCGRQQSLCFSPGQINSRWPPPPPPPPLRVGLNSSGNGEASASRFSVSIALRQMEMASFHHHFRISVSALSLFRGPHTVFRGRTTKLRAAESIYSIENTTLPFPSIQPFLDRTLFSSIEESLVDRFLVGSREINSGEGGSSVKGRFFGNWFSSVGLGDCFGFGRKFRGEREKFLCWFRFRECFLSQTDRKIWFQDFVFEYGIRSNILFKSNGG